MKIMKKYILLFVSSMMLVSCLDTIILPDDKTVDEDFWKSKSDVALMVNAAYAGMSTENVISRLIVWGDFRADEYILSGESENENDATAQALSEMAVVSMQVTNTFASWSDFYSIINKCNVVLKKAEEMYKNGVDPNYTEGDYLADRSQMLALRSLCYFYLVRNFRDVPYVDEAYMTSSQDRQMVQQTPAYVLGKCIESLEEAAGNALQASSYPYRGGNWRRVGWMTYDGICALLADIYLWRASVTHSDADYQLCSQYCDRVIASKKSQHVVGREEQVTEYPLAPQTSMYYDLFVEQNAEESIFEIQCESNAAICKFLHKFKNDQSTAGYFKTTGIFKAAGSHPNMNLGSVVYSENDLRFYTDIFNTTGVDNFDVRKMISLNSKSTATAENRAAGVRAFGGLDQNWIVYRLSDVMLMKAEAMVQMVDTVTAGLTGDALAEKQTTILQGLQDASKLIAAVSQRSCTNGDSLRWSAFPNSFKNKSRMEELVLQERLRELCFEGKRWYDLLRYNYRHVEGVNYDALLADLGEGQLPSNYETMLNLVIRGRGTQGAGIKAKMRNEAYLYLPIPNRDLILSPGLKQNPAYGSSNEYERK